MTYFAKPPHNIVTIGERAVEVQQFRDSKVYEVVRTVELADILNNVIYVTPVEGE